MRAAQHRLLGVLLGESGDGAEGLVDRGQQHGVARVLEHQAVREIVHVLAGAGEVDELGDGGELRLPLHLVLEVVLDRLHVVIGGLLLGLDPLRLGEVEALDDRLQPRVGRGRKRLDLGNAGVCGERLQPADLGNDAVAHQAVLRKDRAQVDGLLGVAPVDGRDGGERSQVHGGARSGAAGILPACPRRRVMVRKSSPGKRNARAPSRRQSACSRQ